MDDETPEIDPLDEAAPPARDRRGRFRKGSSGNPHGRPYYIPQDPTLPASRRRVIHKVADEEVEVKVNGRPQRMTLYEANVRSLGIAGTRDRVAAQRFIDLVQETSDRHLLMRLQSHQIAQYYEKVEEENERLRARYEPKSGPMFVRVPDLNKWNPQEMLDDQGRINLAKYGGRQGTDEVSGAEDPNDDGAGEGG